MIHKTDIEGKAFMRLRLAIMAILGMVLLAATGCGNPGGVDGNLTNGWQPMAPATGFEPKTGTCHSATFSTVGARGSYEEIDCTLPHRSETAYVGTYESPAADADEPPAQGSAGAKTAYQICDDRVTTYVGGPWHTARLWIGVTHPTAAAWSGGARWFRCEVLELSSVEDNGGIVQRSGSLQGLLAGANGSALLLGCYDVQTDESGAIDSMPTVSCTTKHNSEFVGIWDAGKLSYPDTDADWAKFHDGCRGLVATYVGVPDDADLQYRTGVVALPGGNDVWGAGDHAVRCYLWLDGAALTGSVKAMGPGSLPVQYK